MFRVLVAGAVEASIDGYVRPGYSYEALPSST